MSWANYHTHSKYCDGTDQPETYVKEAIAQNMISLGFSSHAPLNFENEWSIRTPFDLENYCAEITELKKTYPDPLEIYLALEMDYIPGITVGFDQFKNSLNLDYIIGSIHLVKNSIQKDLWFIDGHRNNFDNGLKNVFSGDIKKAVTAYYQQSIEMIENQKPDIIGHLDKVKMNNHGRYFHELEPWHISLIRELLESIKRNGTIVEINTRGIYKKKYSGLYPETWVIHYCMKENIPMILSSDAHHPSELTSFFRETTVLLKKMGLKELIIRKNNQWQSVNFDENGYKVSA